MASNNVKVDRYWFDIEPTKKGVSGAACNGWDFSKQANEALAKEWVAAIKASGRNWGIYGNGYVNAWIQCPCFLNDLTIPQQPVDCNVC